MFITLEDIQSPMSHTWSLHFKGIGGNLHVISESDSETPNGDHFAIHYYELIRKISHLDHSLSKKTIKIGQNW